MSTPLLTLLTDFGSKDVYVGVMKGVITQIAPSTTIIDLTHEIPPQDIAAARFNVMNAYPYFPQGTVHVAVVDPGVGTVRRAIALQVSRGVLVGPDNGVFSGIWEDDPVQVAMELTQSQYWRTSTPSQTFHGRDIFAAVGAHLTTGVSIHALGDPIDPATLVAFSLPCCTQENARIRGCIQYIDHFGNLITNIPGAAVQESPWEVQIGSQRIDQKRTYGEVAFGNLLSLIGSHGWVEIASNGGSAQASLNLAVGDPIQVVLKSEGAEQ